VLSRCFLAQHCSLTCCHAENVADRIIHGMSKVDQFAKDVGISQEASSCDMCELFRVNEARLINTIRKRDESLLFLMTAKFQRRQELNMWKLAAFAGWIGLLMFAVASRWQS